MKGVILTLIQKISTVWYSCIYTLSSQCLEVWLFVLHNSSGGRARRDIECFQGRPGGLSVQWQSKHKGWGARLWDGHQMDQTRLQLQSAGNKTGHDAVGRSKVHQNASWDKKVRQNPITTDGTDAVHLQGRISVVVLSILPVCFERRTAWKTWQATPRSFLVVFINFVLQMQLYTAVVHNPRSALPSECALFLVTHHLFVRHSTE